MNERTRKPKRCGAKTRAGSPCRRWARPNGRCHLHGGKSRGGLDSPSFKTGRYSKYVPDNLLTAYDAARADPNLMSTRDSVALIDSRIAELLEQMSTGAASGELWETLIAEWSRLMSAIRRNDTNQQSAAISRLNRIINDGAAAATVWREIYAASEQRRKLVETEQRVITTQQTMVTLDAVLMYLATQIEATKEAIRQYVDDRETQQHIIDAAVESNRRLLGSRSNTG